MKEKLRSLRIENGLTQKELAEILKTNDKNIWNYENGLAATPYDILVAYADYFGVTADYLLGRTDDFDASPFFNENNSYSREEKELIKKYRQLSAPLKKLVKTIIHSQSDNNSNH